MKIINKWIWIKKHFKEDPIKIYFFIYNLLLFYFVFPFNWLIFLPAVLFALITFVFIIKAINLKNKKARYQRYISFSILSSLALLILVLIGPFLINKSPIYVFFKGDLSDINPKKSKYFPLKEGPVNYGTLLIFNDPFHQWSMKIIQILGQKNIYELKETQVRNENFVIMPLKTKFEKITPDMVLSQGTREIYIPSIATGIQIKFKIPYGDSRYQLGSYFGSKIQEHEIGFIQRTDPILDYYYFFSSDIPPWEAILEPNQGSENSLRYAALLDCAITSASLGEIKKAFTLLEEASKYASGNIEHARIDIIMGNISKFLLGGNIGRLQTVPFYHYAFDQLKDNDFKKPFGNRTPAEDWVYRELIYNYKYYGKIFEGRINQLLPIEIKTSELLKIEPINIEKIDTYIKIALDVQKQVVGKNPSEAALTLLAFLKSMSQEKSQETHFFEKEQNRLRKLSGEELLSEAKKLDNPRDARLFCAFRFEDLYSDWMEKIFLPLLQSGSENNLSLFYEYTAKVNSLKIAVEKINGEWQSYYLNKLNVLSDIDNFINTLKDMKLPTEHPAQEIAAIKIFQNLNVSKFGFPILSQYLDIYLKGLENPALNKMDQRKIILSTLNPTAPDVDWFNTIYLDWIHYQITRTEIKQAINQSEKAALEGFLDIGSIERDNKGKGSPFIPGIAFLALASDEFHLSTHSSYKAEFEKYIEAPYDQFMTLNEIYLGY